jgi:hypothetical protein
MAEKTGVSASWSGGFKTGKADFGLINRFALGIFHKLGKHHPALASRNSPRKPGFAEHSSMLMRHSIDDARPEVSL